jgi:hypothetical protein
MPKEEVSSEGMQVGGVKLMNMGSFWFGAGAWIYSTLTRSHIMEGKVSVLLI